VVCGLWFRVYSLWPRVQGLRLRVEWVGSRPRRRASPARSSSTCLSLQGLAFVLEGWVFSVQGSGLTVYGFALGFRFRDSWFLGRALTCALPLARSALPPYPATTSVSPQGSVTSISEHPRFVLALATCGNNQGDCRRGFDLTLC